MDVREGGRGLPASSLLLGDGLGATEVSGMPALAVIAVTAGFTGRQGLWPPGQTDLYKRVRAVAELPHGFGGPLACNEC